MKLSAIVFLVALGVAAVHGQDTNQCNICQSTTNIRCESESTYYICLGNKQYGPNYCDTDEVCTNTDAPCVAKSELSSTVLNVCATSGSCQTCSETSTYTCVSSTQAARCVSGQLSTSVIIDCGTDEICVSDAVDTFSTPCVPQCVADFANWNSSCSNAEYVPPTQAPPTTPSATEMQTICQTAAATKNTRYFYTYADSTCRTYVYCQRSSLTTTIFTTTLTGSCSSPTPYFDTARGVCQATKSASCLAEAPTTVAPTGSTASSATTQSDSSSTAVSSTDDSSTAAPTTAAPTTAAPTTAAPTTAAPTTASPAS